MTNNINRVVQLFRKVIHKPFLCNSCAIYNYLRDQPPILDEIAQHEHSIRHTKTTNVHKNSMAPTTATDTADIFLVSSAPLASLLASETWVSVFSPNVMERGAIAMLLEDLALAGMSSVDGSSPPFGALEDFAAGLEALAE
jgi:hypothetical protein